MTRRAATFSWKRRAWADWGLILLFGLLVGLPTLDWFAGLDGAEPPGENRQLARKPGFSRWDLLNPQPYLAAAERYFKDHFGFRNSLLFLCQRGKLWLFHEQGGNSAVRRGLHGWLFYDGDEDLVGNYLCLARFSDAQLQAWQRLLETRRDWLAARGVKYLFVVPPDKQDIYPEELPPWLTKAAPPHRQTKLDQLMQYLQAHSTVAVLDLRPALLAAKTGGPVYLQTDTHWNDRGSFVACREVVGALAKQLPGLHPLRSEDFFWSNAPAIGGDLARMIGARPSERNWLAFIPEPGVIMPVVQSTPETGPAPGIRTMISENPARSATAVVLHDSFGAKWTPFLGCSFKRIVYRWAPGLDARVIAENQPQVVIDEMLERLVDSRDPATLLAQDKLP